MRCNGNTAAELPTWPYTTCDWIDRMFMPVPKQNAAKTLRHRSDNRGRWLGPLHDDEPRRTTVERGTLRIATPWGGLLKKTQHEPLLEEFGHVGAKRAMPILDLDTSPFDPLRKFLKIPVDGKVQGATMLVSYPSLRSTRRSKARQVGDQQGAAHLQDPR